MAKKKKTGVVVKALTPKQLLKRRIRAHFKKIGFTKADDGTLQLPGTDKGTFRKLHSSQRTERLDAAKNFLGRALPKVLPYFADGSEIEASKIKLRSGARRTRRLARRSSNRKSVSSRLILQWC